MQSNLISRIRARGPFLVLLTLSCLVPLLHVAGCAGPGYYAQAAAGHLGLMRDRKEIAEILAEPGTDPNLARQLQLALEIRQFAIDELNLPDSGSYTKFVATGRDAITWNVVAAPEFSLEPRQWCFLVSGCVPYRGYFDLQKAEKFAATLEAKALDVTVSPAIAYSTLGWFDDPLLDTMFQYSDEQLAAFLFHEMAHQQLYVKGDTAFNEAYAGFIEEKGVREWLKASGRVELLPRWESLEKASIEFNSLLQETRDRLSDLYASEALPERMRQRKAGLLARMRTEYRTLVEKSWDNQDYFGSWFSAELNNAKLALMNSYQGGACAFSRLFEAADRQMGRFQRLAAERARLGKSEREAWLNQSCRAIASGGKL